MFNIQAFFFFYRYGPHFNILYSYLMPFPVCIFTPDILLQTTHLAPRSLSMRRTAQWPRGSSGCEKSLIKWECGGQWRVFSLSMNTGYLMFYFCSWAPRSLSCEWLMFSHLYEPEVWTVWQLASLLQAWGRVESRGRWGGGSETPYDWGNYITAQLNCLVALVILKFIYTTICLDVRSSGGRMVWSRTGWLMTVLATGGAPTLSLHRLVQLDDKDSNK